MGMGCQNLAAEGNLLQDMGLLPGSWCIQSLALEGQETPAAMFSSASAWW
jgi:hypothetical protein